MKKGGYCTWRKGDYDTVPGRRLIPHDRLLTWGKGWLPYCKSTANFLWQTTTWGKGDYHTVRVPLISYDRLLYLGKGCLPYCKGTANTLWQTTIPGERVSPYAWARSRLQRWARTPCPFSWLLPHPPLLAPPPCQSNFYQKRDKIANFGFNSLSPEQNLQIQIRMSFHRFLLDPDWHIKSWIRNPSTRQSLVDTVKCLIISFNLDYHYDVSNYLLYFTVMTLSIKGASRIGYFMS